MSCENSDTSSSSSGIVIYQGSTFSAPMTFSMGCDTPIDVSQWTFTGQIRATYSSVDVIANFVFAPGATSNIVNMSLSAAITALIPVNAAINTNLTPTLYVFGVTATKPDLTVQTIWSGSVAVYPRVTQ